MKVALSRRRSMNRITGEEQTKTIMKNLCEILMENSLKKLTES